MRRGERAARRPAGRAWRATFAATFATGGLALLLGSTAPAQDPSPGAEPALVGNLVRRGHELLDQEDPMRAWDAFRALRSRAPDCIDGLLGLGRVHLLLGAAPVSVRYADAARSHDPRNQEAMALAVRSLIRCREFDGAVAASTRFLAEVHQPGADLLAARASALFRVQRIDEAGAAYRRVLTLQPLHGEAHLRLGSGLLPPTRAVVGPDLLAAVRAARQGDHDAAIGRLQTMLAAEPDHPIAHRLLGEVLWQRRCDASMATADPAFAQLRAALPQPDLRHLPVADFVAGYRELSERRRLVVDRALGLFARHLPRLLSLGGRHDLLLEIDRTTDAPARSTLRGQRTFDGRVWDDVRGIGGLQAATGIEALDEAAELGFDTLAHELAHQVHYFALQPLERARIRDLYHRARANDRCLDHYAATNEAEYFGQGVEAFHSYAKRPGCETTHGHTRFELFRVDRDLHDFIASIVDQDPLADPLLRYRILTAAVDVALVCGRADDAVVAAGMLEAGGVRDRLLEKAVRARQLWQGY